MCVLDIKTFFSSTIKKTAKWNGAYVLIGKKYMLNLNICFIETSWEPTQEAEVCGKPLQMQIPAKSPGAMLKGLLQELITACFDYL